MQQSLPPSAPTEATSGAATDTLASPLYPDIADISHAAPALVEFLRHYFQSKSRHDADAWLQDFDTSKIVYIETVLGLSLNPANFESSLRAIMASWGEGAVSYPLRIIGDMDSAVIFFEDTPAMFGHELRGVAALDMENGKITRQVDYWDGRRAPLAATRLPDPQYPADLGVSVVAERSPNAVLHGIVSQLHAALSTGNSSAAAALFDVDAVWEDRTARTLIDGGLAIERYVARAWDILPYGDGATIRHVVGSAQGGGYEWIGRRVAVTDFGMTALKLNESRMITWISSVWDASHASYAAMATLTGLSLES